MTTGIGLPASAGLQRAYLERLDDAGVACLALSEQLFVPPLSRQFLAAADERGFAVVEVPIAVPFMAISQEVAAAVQGDTGQRLNAQLQVFGAVRWLAAGNLSTGEIFARLERLSGYRLYACTTPAGPAAGRGPGPAARPGEAHTGHADQPADGPRRVRAAGVRAAGHRGLHPGHGDGRRRACRRVGGPAHRHRRRSPAVDAGARAGDAPPGRRRDAGRDAPGRAGSGRGDQAARRARLPAGRQADAGDRAAARPGGRLRHRRGHARAGPVPAARAAAGGRAVRPGPRRPGREGRAGGQRHDRRGEPRR